MNFVAGCDRPLSDADRAFLRRVVDRLYAHDGRVLLDDLEWCGKAGEARYPGDFYMGEEVVWCEGVKGRGLIEKAHVEYPDKLIVPEGHES